MKSLPVLWLLALLLVLSCRDPVSSAPTTSRIEYQPQALVPLYVASFSALEKGTNQIYLWGQVYNSGTSALRLSPVLVLFQGDTPDSSAFTFRGVLAQALLESPPPLYELLKADGLLQEIPPRGLVSFLVVSIPLQYMTPRPERWLMTWRPE